jgi:hypothetical protein
LTVGSEAAAGTDAGEGATVAAEDCTASIWRLDCTLFAAETTSRDCRISTD